MPGTALARTRSNTAFRITVSKAPQAHRPNGAAKVLAKPTLIGWFVGQAMKASGGKANPQALNDILKKKLGLE